ncbi:MAG: nitroreductase family protein, partial [Candidatus Eremiobacteraeota bacterium]|nr:nitroreductase family protein [Candidatus Eremiobacteraeota bacterium]
MLSRSVSFFQELKRRRTVREFSSRPIPVEVVKNCLLAAGTAPN